MVFLLENEWFIQAPWGKICVISWGNCFDPPVLLCHGEELSAASFRPLVQHLPRRFYYIGMEFPGAGRSDPFPPGMPINAHDMAYAIALLVKHFRWTEFGCIARSIAVHYAKIYNLCYPGVMNKFIELDPTPFYSSIMSVKQFSQWYHKYFIDFFNNYQNYNASKNNAPSFTNEQAIEMLKSTGLDENTASLTLNRISEPVGPGMVRFTYDRRVQLVSLPPYTTTQANSLFTNLKTPTLAIITESSVKQGVYKNALFALDESKHLTKNYRVKIVTNLDRSIVFVCQFLLFGLDGIDRRAKL